MQPFIIIFFNQPGALHGPLLHSFIGATLLALPLTAIIFILKRPLQTITSFLRLNQKPTIQSILAGSLIGVYSHILLDATLYTDIQPFYPSTTNPLLSHDPNRYYMIYTACAIAFIIALVMYGFCLWKKTQHPTLNTPTSKK
jgi:membrane-bound metal-dependent hydrolase YbcI (DUF457 family)